MFARSITRFTAGNILLSVSFALLLVCSSVEAQEHRTESGKAATKEVAEVTLESVLEKYRERSVEKWEEKIKALEERNASEGEWPSDSLLFFGSSSFRLWKTMGKDMAPFPAINRGYGGAKYIDMVLFAERMLTPHRYRALMLFAANDVQGKEDDSTPEEVSCAVKEIIRVSKTHRPDAPVFIIEVTPTESRFKAWEQTRAINATLREIALTTENTWFVETAQHYLKPDGTPRSELFVDDKLHMNQKGYTQWSGLIKNELNWFLPVQKSASVPVQNDGP